MLPAVPLCDRPNWAITIPQGSTFLRELNFGDTDMTGVSLRGGIARRPGSSLLCSYTVTPVSAYALGADEAVNGAFAADTDWTKGTGVTISGGVARFTGVANQVGLTAAVPPLTSGSWWSVAFTVGGYVAGDLEVMLGTVRVAVPVTGDGTYTVAGLANATGLTVRAVGVTTLTLDNLTLRAITPCRVTLGLTATQTAALPAGAWWHDVEAYTAGGWVGRILSGAATVTPEVTR